MNSDYDLYKKSNYSEPHSQNRLCEAFLNNMLACYLLIVVTSPYKDYQLLLRMQAFDAHLIIFTWL